MQDGKKIWRSNSIPYKFSANSFIFSSSYTLALLPSILEPFWSSAIVVGLLFFWLPSTSLRLGLRTKQVDAPDGYLGTITRTPSPVLEPDYGLGPESNCKNDAGTPLSQQPSCPTGDKAMVI